MRSGVNTLLIATAATPWEMTVGTNDLFMLFFENLLKFASYDTSRIRQ